MTDRIEVFFIEPTGKHQRSLRRYSNGRPCPKMPGDYSYCNASVYLDTIEKQEPSGDTWPHDDPRWPKHCERCGGEFREGDAWQLKQGNRSRPIGEERWFRRLGLMSGDGLCKKFQHVATLRAAT